MAANPSIQLGTDGNWAIKEDNLLAYKKDGTRFFNKEFDFTRGTFATFVDKDGLIKYSGVTDTELVVNGDFATSLNGWTNSNNHWQWTSQGAYFPLISTHNPLTQILTNPVGVKLKITFTLNIVQGTAQIYYNNINNSTVSTQYTQSGTYTLITEPVKQNTDINFSRYGGINTEFYLNNVSAFEIQTDVPRIDFTDDATGHLLLEPQSTNLITYSEDFSQWTKYNSSVNTNSIQSPSGFLDADKIIENTSNSTHFVAPIVNNVPSSGVATLSVFAKKGENNWIKLVQYTNYANFDLGNGVIGNSSAISTNIIDYGNGWYKCIMNFNVAGSGANLDFKLGENNTSNWDDIYTGDGTSGVYLWGAQLEPLSYATSYIPTLVSTATRNGEVCTNSGSVQDFNSEEGVLYYEASYIDGSDYNSISILNSSGSEKIRTWYDNTNLIFASYVNNVNQTFISYPISKNINYKIAVRYKLNDFVLYVNGIKATNIIVNLGGVSPQNSYTKLNLNSGDIYNNLYGKTKDLKVFKRAMSDGELYLLTVTQYQSYQEMATALNYTL